MSGDSRRVIVSHASGNRNVRETLTALSDASLLYKFWSTLAWPGDINSRYGVLPVPVSKMLKKRQYTMLRRNQIRVSPFRELFRSSLRVAPARSLRKMAETDERFGMTWVSEGLDRRVARSLPEHVSAVYSYLDQSSSVFRAARSLGINRILEVHHVHCATAQRLVDDERERSPEWANTLPRATHFARSLKRQDEEIALADAVVCPSRQTAESVVAVRPSASIVMAPYGCPPASPWSRIGNWEGRAPLRILYVGRLTATKGLADVAAVKQHFGNRVSLSLIGHRPNVILPVLDTLLEANNYLGTLFRDDVLQQMGQHDLLLAPSLFEGRSLSVLEALSVGLPAVVTPGTGTEDIVSRGGGVVVPARSPEALIDAIEAVFATPERISCMSTAALESATILTWEGFRRTIVDLARSI